MAGRMVLAAPSASSRGPWCGRLCLLVCGAVFQLGLTMRASAGDLHEVDPDRLHLRLILPVGGSESVADGWQESCEELGLAFVQGSGPWGFGPFKSFDCGTVAKRSKVAEGDSYWLWLSEAHRKGATAATAELTGGKDQRTLVAVDLPISLRRGEAELLGTRSVALALAGGLLGQLPFLGRVAAEDLKVGASGGQRLRRPKAAGSLGLPPPPQDLDLFTLERDEESGIWHPEPQAHAVAVAGVTDGWEWVVTPELKANDQVILVQDGRGLEAQAEAFQQGLLRELKASREVRAAPAGRLGKAAGAAAAAERPSRFAASGMASLRYGRANGVDPILKQVSGISLIAEFTAFRSADLRLVGDYWPSVSTSVSTGLSHLAGQRALLALAFLLPREWLGPFDRIDLAPRIGRWSMSMSGTRLDPNNQPAVASFTMKGALSLGVETGIEALVFGPHRLRAYAAYDFGNNPLLKTQKTRVTTLRSGLDGVISLGQSRAFGVPLSLAPLLVGAYEQLSFQRQGVTSDIVEIKSVSFSMVYLGLGLAVSW